MAYSIGIDLGGTNIVAGLVNDRCEIFGKDETKTRLPRPAAEICDDIAALCRRLTDALGVPLVEVEWVGMGSPGLISDGVVHYASNLGFNETPLAALLQERVGKPVYLANDGNAAAYGEWAAGAGRGFDSVAALTIGTGIGAGLVVDRRILAGFNGGAGELGHTVVHAGGRICSCGKRGCLEAYCSAKSLGALTREAMRANPDSLMWRLCGGDAAKAGARTSFDAKRAGDAVGTKVVEAFLYYLSIGVSNAINLLQPQVFCIGGGVSREGDAIILPLRELVKEQTYIRDPAMQPKIVAAQLGNDAGLVGAAMLGRMQRGEQAK